MKQLEQFGEQIAKQQIRKPGFFITITLLLVAIMIPGILLLIGHVEPSLEKILPQEVQEVQLMNNMRGEFGADMMHILITSTGPAEDVLDPDVVKYVDLLATKLETNEFILQTTSIADLVKDMNNNIIPESNQEIRRILALNPRTAMYLNDNRDLTIIQVRSDTGATASTIKQTVEDMTSTIDSLEEHNPGVETRITGFNAIDKATFEVIMQDFMFITGFSFLFMLIFLGFYFKSGKKVFSTVSVIMVSLFITLGITGYLGIEITVVTMVAAAMIMALGISYGINVTYEYSSLRKTQTKKKTLVTLNKQLIRALIGSSLTTSAGFLALLFGVIPAMKNLGIVLAMGIVVTLFVSIFFLPTILYTLDKVKTQ